MAVSPEGTKPPDDEIRPEYDFRTMRGVVRGKYAADYRERLRIVRLAKDVASFRGRGGSKRGSARILAEPARRRNPGLTENDGGTHVGRRSIVSISWRDDLSIAVECSELDEFLGIMRQIKPFLVRNRPYRPLLHGQRAKQDFNGTLVLVHTDLVDDQGIGHDGVPFDLGLQ